MGQILLHEMLLLYSFHLLSESHHYSKVPDIHFRSYLNYLEKDGLMINTLNKVDIYFPPTISQIIERIAMNSNALFGGGVNRHRQVTRTTTKLWLKCKE